TEDQNVEFKDLKEKKETFNGLTKNKMLMENKELTLENIKHVNTDKSHSVEIQSSDIYSIPLKQLFLDRDTYYIIVTKRGEEEDVHTLSKQIDSYHTKEDIHFTSVMLTDNKNIDQLERIIKEYNSSFNPEDKGLNPYRVFILNIKD